MKSLSWGVVAAVADDVHSYFTLLQYVKTCLLLTVGTLGLFINPNQHLNKSETIASNSIVFSDFSFIQQFLAFLSHSFLTITKTLLVCKHYSSTNATFGWSYRKFRKVETRAIEAFTHSTFVIILYFTLFQKKNRQRNKQISRFVFIPVVNNKLTTAG